MRRRETALRTRLDMRLARGLTPFVGRQAEMALLDECWAQARDGVGRVMMIREAMTRMLLESGQLRKTPTGYELTAALGALCIERWDGTLRGVVAPAAPHPRSILASSPPSRTGMAASQSLQLRDAAYQPAAGRTRRPPAMAIGLTDPGWSSRESLWLPVHPDPRLREQIEQRVAHLQTPALQGPASRSHTGATSSRLWTTVTHGAQRLWPYGIH
jgi:hypothetical protein